MSFDKKTVSLSSIATIFDSDRVPLNSRERSKRKGIIPYYGAQGVIDYVDDHLFEGDYVLIAEDGENLRSKKLPVAFRASGKFWVNNHAHILQGNELWINDYIEAFFNYADISPYITGAAQPKLNQENLLKIQLPFEEENARKAALVWKLFQKKIELNRRMNETLEQIGQALFKKYFLDNTEREEWSDGKLSEIAHNIKVPVSADKNLIGKIYLPIEKLTMKSLSIIEPAPVEDAKSSLIAFQKNDVLLGAMRVYFHRVNVAPEDGITRSTVFVLRPIKADFQGYVTFLLNQESTIEYANITSKGSTMPYAVWENGLADMKIKIPPIDRLDSFNQVIKPILEKIRDSYRVNSCLSQMRDLLLPRLIGGEITT